MGGVDGYQEGDKKDRALSERAKSMTRGSFEWLMAGVELIASENKKDLINGGKLEKARDECVVSWWNGLVGLADLFLMAYQPSWVI